MKPCTPPIEFVQCPTPCGAVWAKPPHTSWKDYSICPECHKHSTYDIDMHWVLVEDAEESCWGNTRVSPFYAGR